MIVDFNDARSIDMLIDQDKNIVIFPRSVIKQTFEADGEIFQAGLGLLADYPIEVSYPYTAEVLAEKIKYGIEQFDIHECYREALMKKTLEEKYYGVKGFKNATKGKRHISLGWNRVSGKYVTLSGPEKRSFSAYYGLDTTRLSEDAEWIDFANVVIGYVDIDITQLKNYKICKRFLNL